MFAARLSGFSVTAGHLELHWVTYRTASSRYGHGLPPVGFSIASIPDIFLVLHASSVKKKVGRLGAESTYSETRERRHSNTA